MRVLEQLSVKRRLSLCGAQLPNDNQIEDSELNKNDLPHFL